MSKIPFFFPFECMWCGSESDPADDMQTALNKGWNFQSGGKRVFCSSQCGSKWWEEENAFDEQFWARIDREEKDDCSSS